MAISLPESTTRFALTSPLSSSDISSMALTPISASALTSSSWLIPSLFLSCHTLRAENISSSVSIRPSPFKSYCIRASNPLFASDPSGMDVAVPNSSEPSFMIPSLLRSSARSASSLAIHCVFSMRSLLSASKYTPSSTDSNSKPSPSKSSTSGSATRIRTEAAVEY